MLCGNCQWQLLHFFFFLFGSLCTNAHSKRANVDNLLTFLVSVIFHRNATPCVPFIFIFSSCLLCDCKCLKPSDETTNQQWVAVILGLNLQDLLGRTERRGDDGGGAVKRRRRLALMTLAVGRHLDSLQPICNPYTRRQMVRVSRRCSAAREPGVTGMFRPSL